LNKNKISPDKLKSLENTSREIAGLQDKSFATRNASGRVKELYDLPDNLAPQQAIELENKFLDTLDGLEGEDAAIVRNAIEELHISSSKTAKEAGIFDQYNIARQASQKNRLRNKLTSIVKSNSIPSTKSGDFIVSGENLLNNLNKNRDNLINAYGMTREHFDSLKMVARALNQIESQVVPRGTSIAAGAQIWSPASFAIASATGNVPAMTSTGTLAATVLLAPPIASSKWLLANPYILGSTKATNVLAKGLQQGGNTARLADVFSKAYIAYRKDKEN